MMTTAMYLQAPHRTALVDLSARLLQTIPNLRVPNKKGEYGAATLRNNSSGAESSWMHRLRDIEFGFIYPLEPKVS